MYLYAYSRREGGSCGNLTSNLTQAVSLHTDSTYMYLYAYSCRRGQLRKLDLMSDTGNKLTLHIRVYSILYIYVSLRILLEKGGQLRKPDLMSDTGSKPSY
jgi:hypothetical protein